MASRSRELSTIPNSDNSSDLSVKFFSRGWELVRFGFSVAFGFSIEFNFAFAFYFADCSSFSSA